MSSITYDNASIHPISSQSHYSHSPAGSCSPSSCIFIPSFSSLHLPFLLFSLFLLIKHLHTTSQNVWKGARSHRQRPQASARHLQPGHQGQWHGLCLWRRAHGPRHLGPDSRRHPGSHRTLFSNLRMGDDEILPAKGQRQLTSLSFCPTAPMHQEPVCHPRGCRHQPGEGRQGQRLPGRHGRLWQDERGLQHLLGRCQALPNVRIFLFFFLLFFFTIFHNLLDL